MTRLSHLFSFLFLLVSLNEFSIAQNNWNIDSLYYYPFWGPALRIAVEENFAYVITDDSYLRIVNISNLTHPIESGYCFLQEVPFLCWY
jgi:hypothetical protein